MSKQLTICMKTAWLASAATLLLMGTGMCVSTDATCFEAGDTMLFLMLWLGFPTSLGFIVGSQIILDPVMVHSPSNFITAWMLMAAGGLLQWFILVPRFLKKPDLTLLKLGTSVTLPSVGSNDAILPATEVIQSAPVQKPAILERQPAPVQSKAVQVVRDRTRSRRKSIKSIAAFDRAGRTPLERVIDHLSSAV
jgi:hypothetical protein